MLYFWAKIGQFCFKKCAKCDQFLGNIELIGLPSLEGSLYTKLDLTKLKTNLFVAGLAATHVWSFLQAERMSENKYHEKIFQAQCSTVVYLDITTTPSPTSGSTILCSGGWSTRGPAHASVNCCWLQAERNSNSKFDIEPKGNKAIVNIDVASVASAVSVAVVGATVNESKIIFKFIFKKVGKTTIHSISEKNREYFKANMNIMATMSAAAAVSTAAAVSAAAANSAGQLRGATLCFALLSLTGISRSESESKEEEGECFKAIVNAATTTSGSAILCSGGWSTSRGPAHAVANNFCWPQAERILSTAVDVHLRTVVIIKEDKRRELGKRAVANSEKEIKTDRKTEKERSLRNGGRKKNRQESGEYPEVNTDTAAVSSVYFFFVAPQK